MKGFGTISLLSDWMKERMQDGTDKRTSEWVSDWLYKVWKNKPIYKYINK